MRPRPATAQSASAVLMIRPAHFAGNAETRATNRFQRTPDRRDDAAVAADARRESDALAEQLDRRGVAVHRFDGHAGEPLPDEVFPNNWISLHADGTLVLYPLAARNRRPERRPDIIDALTQRFAVERVIDLSGYEHEARCLEGTGSLVLDHVERIAYAARSSRTHAAVLADWAGRLGYEPVVFDTADPDGAPLYHTNVLMAIGSDFAVLGRAAIRDPAAAERIAARLAAGGRELITLEWPQLESFAGNLLELRGRDGPLIVLSARALAALGRAGRERLARHGELVAVDIDTIETLGGGSVRCTLAEIFAAPR